MSEALVTLPAGLPPLLARQRLFIHHYLNCLNVSQASDLSGLSIGAGQQYLRDSNVQQHIQEALKDVAPTPGEVIARISLHARTCIADFLDANGQIDLKLAAERGVLGALKKLKYDLRGMPEIETTDPLRALELLGKVFALFTEKHVNVNISNEVTQARSDMASAMNDPVALEKLIEAAEAMKASVKRPKFVESTSAKAK